MTLLDVSGSMNPFVIPLAQKSRKLAEMLLYSSQIDYKYINESVKTLGLEYRKNKSASDVKLYINEKINKMVAPLSAQNKINPLEQKIHKLAMHLEKEIVKNSRIRL